MIVLDENISEHQRELLHGWRIRARQIGIDLSRKGIKDEQIIPLLLGLRLPTFFTRDLGFYTRKLCHARYCLVCLDTRQDEAALFARRILRHSAFDSRLKRMGKVARVSNAGIFSWQLHDRQESVMAW